MEWLTSNLGLICTILSALVGIAGALIGLFGKGKKSSKVLSGLSTVIKQFPEFIRTAEKVSTNAEDKLKYVLNQAILSCKALGFTPDDEQLLDMTERVEEMVKLSKEINLHVKTYVKEEVITEVKAPEVIEDTVITEEVSPVPVLGGDINEGY